MASSTKEREGGRDGMTGEKKRMGGEKVKACMGKICLDFGDAGKEREREGEREHKSAIHVYCDVARTSIEVLNEERLATPSHASRSATLPFRRSRSATTLAGSRLPSCRILQYSIEPRPSPNEWKIRIFASVESDGQICRILSKPTSIFFIMLKVVFVPTISKNSF